MPKGDESPEGKQKKSLSREERKVKEVERLFRRQEEAARKKAHRRQARLAKAKAKQVPPEPNKELAEPTENEKEPEKKRVRRWYPRACIACSRNPPQENKESMPNSEPGPKAALTSSAPVSVVPNPIQDTPNAVFTPAAKKPEMTEVVVAVTTMDARMAESQSAMANAEPLEFKTEADFKANFGKKHWLRAYQHAEIERNVQQNHTISSTGSLPECIHDKTEHDTLQWLIERTKLVQKGERMTEIPDVSPECPSNTHTNMAVSPLLARLQKASTTEKPSPI